MRSDDRAPIIELVEPTGLIMSLRRYLPLQKDLLAMGAPVSFLVCIQIGIGMITLIFAGTSTADHASLRMHGTGDCKGC